MSTRQPDDPENKSRKRPPELPWDRDQSNIPNFNKAMEKRYELGQKIGRELKHFMLYAFLAETDCHPTEVTLVQGKNADGLPEWWYMRHDQVARHNAIVRNLKRQIDILAKHVDISKLSDEELRELKALDP